MTLVDSGYFRWRRIGSIVVLWGGLLLCVAAIPRYWRECQELFRGIGVDGLVWLSAAFFLIWMLAVLSWKRVVAVYSRTEVTTPVAARHLALLLLGKYLPGGVWGFAARLSNSAQGRSIGGMFAAGLAEQWLGLISILSLASVGFFSSLQARTSWLWAACLVPPFVLATFILFRVLLQFAGRVLPARWRDGGAPSSRFFVSRPMWEAVVMTSTQQLLILGSVAMLAHFGYALGWEAAVGVAASYGLAITAGILVVFLPGGIVVREGVFVALSNHWMQPSQAIALAAGLRLAFTAFDLLAGVLGSGLLSRVRRA